MKLDRFINRPVLSTVISIIIVILGVIGLVTLPIEQYPDIAPPTVSVRASYTGANAQTTLNSVVVPLEEAINGVENMDYMSSSASNTGDASITITFKQGTDPDMAAVNVQNKVSSATGLLPAEVTKIGVTTEKRQNSMLMVFTLYDKSGKYDQRFIENYAKINIIPEIQRVNGVGEAFVMGADYSMRIWLKPELMAQYHLMPADVTTALAQQNIEAAPGKIGERENQTFEYTLRYRGRLQDEHEFENIVIRATSDGQILRLKDIARIEMGTVNYDLRSTTKGKTGASASITQTAGSNANDLIKQIDKVEDEMRKSLPAGMVLEDQTSVMDFLNASIQNVVETLLIALVLVIIVVALFLRDRHSIIIPSVAIIVSLIGTFIFMYLAGFTLNILTLFALVLVIGTVVDDSIVVVEAVQTKMANGISNVYEATISTMKELKSALVTTTIVFMAVFIPVSFISGTTGIFYKEFGLTMAAAVALSLLNALTLCPVMCNVVLKRKKTVAPQKQRVLRNKLIGKYESGIVRLLRHRKLVVFSLPVAIALLIFFIFTTKTGLVPQEDMGTIDVNVQCKPGYSLAQTGMVMDRVEKLVRNIPQIKIYTRVDSKDAQQNQTSSAGFLSVRLKHWSERKAKGDDIDSVVNEIYRRTACIKEAKVNCGTLPMIRGYGSSSGFELYVQNRSNEDFNSLSEATQQFLDELNKRSEISKAHSTFDTSYPQYEVSVDAAKCMMKNISPKDVMTALADYVGGDYASNLNKYTKLYRVMVQASPQFRLNEQSLSYMYVRGGDGFLSPLSEYVTLKKINGPEYLTHFNLFPGIRINGTPAAGYSSGQALQAISEVAARTLPVGYGYELSGMSREESSQGNTTAVILIISMVFIYLILSSLYESLLLPFAILLVIPFGLLGSFVLASVFDIENNIYMQTGLAMLIGMLAKTAILLTEVAVKLRRENGLSITAAALAAARLRFRPIVMTATVMIFGMLPLVFSTGAGAKGDISIGMGVLGGMIVGTPALLFLVPVLFCLFEKYDKKR